MARLEDYYHDGDEVSSRGELRESEGKAEKLSKSEKLEDKRKELAQKRWLNVENPFLWQGNVDYDDF